MNNSIQWASHYLASHGYVLKNSLPDEVQHTPWSYVARFSTTKGFIYLKQTPEAIALEADITRLLRDQFHASVPEVIAFNAELSGFLMKDAGSPLRARLKKQFDTRLLCRAIDEFTSIQLAVSDQVTIFLDLGVPDWRLDKLPDLYQQLLLQKNILAADGLSETEWGTLQTLQPMVTDLCRKLAAYSVKESIVQCDFHDNNILVDAAENITVIDLGEIVISHPFFSLVGCLRQAKFHHGLIEEGEAYQQLMSACLANFASQKSLIEAFSIARVLWFVYESLAQYRLRLACDEALFLAFQKHGRLSGQLREFIKATQA